MGRRTLTMIEISEILYRWQRGMSKQAIAISLGISRNTVKKEIGNAQAYGLNKHSQEEIIQIYLAERAHNKIHKKKKGQQMQVIKKYHNQIIDWLNMPHMTIKQAQRLLSEQGHVFPYTTLQRYIHGETDFLTKKISTVHLETIPGEQAQVDFGYVGLLFDPISKKMKKSHIFIMTLSHSRHRFVYFVCNYSAGID